MDIPFSKGILKSSHTSNLAILLPLKEVISYEDDEAIEEEEGLNPLDLPPIFIDCGDTGALGFKELGETSIPSSFCEEEELACKEEPHLPLYKVVCFQQEDKVEVTRDVYSLPFLVSSNVSHCFQPVHPWPVNKEPQTQNLHQESIKNPYTLTLGFTSRKPKVRPKRFRGSFPMAGIVDGNQKESEIPISLQKPNYKMPHKFTAA